MRRLASSLTALLIALCATFGALPPLVDASAAAQPADELLQNQPEPTVTAAESPATLRASLYALQTDATGALGAPSDDAAYAKTGPVTVRSRGFDRYLPPLRC